jgi:2-polyprenyl-6-methoxyphenol hydroxylase-like FAD-dependent oxidoreductase
VVKTVAFYEGEARRAEVSLSKLPASHPFVVVLPQSAFEDLLEKRLRKDGNIHVQWNHQLSGMRAEGSTAVASVDELDISAKGYIVPEMDWSVKRTETLHTSYIVGADGPNSFVARLLNSEWERVGQPEFFAVFEMQSDWPAADELRIVVEKGVKSVLWPQSGRGLRWSFQLREEHLADFPVKERKSVLLGQMDTVNREFVQRLVRSRAPWFNGAIEELGWSTDVEFEHRVAARFGHGHCWLVGDAAHQTGPAGMQSMNVGLLEAERLAAALINVLRDNAAPELLEEYNRACRDEWTQLLGINAGLKIRPATSPWVKEHRADLLECLPSSGEDLKLLLHQLELDAP